MSKFNYSPPRYGSGVWNLDRECDETGNAPDPSRSLSLKAKREVPKAENKSSVLNKPPQTSVTTNDADHLPTQSTICNKNSGDEEVDETNPEFHRYCRLGLCDLQPDLDEYLRDDSEDEEPADNGSSLAAVNEQADVTAEGNGTGRSSHKRKRSQSLTSEKIEKKLKQDTSRLLSPPADSSCPENQINRQHHNAIVKRLEAQTSLLRNEADQAYRRMSSCLNKFKEIRLALEENQVELAAARQELKIFKEAMKAHNQKLYLDTLRKAKGVEEGSS